MTRGNMRKNHVIYGVKKVAAVGLAMGIMTCAAACGRADDYNVDVEHAELEEMSQQADEAAKQAMASFQDALAEDEATATDTVDVFNNGIADGIYFIGNNLYCSENDVTLINASYDEIVLPEALKEACPELESNVQRANGIFADQAQDAINDQDALSLARDMSKDDPDNFTAFDHDQKCFIRRADEQVLSFALFYYDFEGGAHGYSHYQDLNLDMKTGAVIELDDVVADKDGMAEFVFNRISEWYPDITSEEAFNLEAVKDSFAGTEEFKVAFTIDPDGVTFYFAPYDLASYAAGKQEVKVLFDEAPDLFTGKYTEQEGAWAINFQASDMLGTDLDDDGVADRINLYGEVDEYDTIVSINASVNGNEYKEDLYGFSIDPVLIHAEDGSEYIYGDVAAEGDSAMLEVYSVGKDGFKRIGGLNGGVTCADMSFGSDETSYWSSYAQLYDPACFYLKFRMELVSTYSGYKTYSIGADGIPETKDNSYISGDTYIELTFKKDMLVDIADEDGEVISEEEAVTAGSKGVPYRTDNESYVDLELEDGRLARIYIDNADEWPRTVDGEALEDVFDGVLFAG